LEKTLRIDPKDPRPIWRQIEEGVQYLVASGSLAVGAGVPSVRDLARELQVNPATVSRAYQRLTDAGVLSVRRGDGTYVSDAPPLLTPAERADRLAQAALRYAGTAITLGASRETATDALAEAWEDLKAEPSEETR
jgi:GntR family transcriptional regulator